MIVGNTTYSTPTGDQLLPYLAKPGMYTFGGQNYFVDENQNYYQVDARTGLMTPISRK